MNEPFESLGGHKLLAVQWIDTRFDADARFRPDQLKEFLPATIWSVGWGFVLPDRVVLGSEYYPDTPTQNESYRDGTVFPKECVKQVIELMAKPEPAS